MSAPFDIDPSQVVGGAAIQQQQPELPSYGNMGVGAFSEQSQGELGAPMVDPLSARLSMAHKASEKAKVPPEVADQRPFIVKLLTAPIDLSAGITEGLLGDPLLNYVSPIHLLYNGVADKLGLPSTSALAAQIDHATKGHTMADIGQLVGELAPSFALGAGLFSLGRAAAVKALQYTAIRTVGAALPEALEFSIAPVRLRAALTAGDEVVLKGGLERGAEIVGGAAGSAVAGAVEAKSQGGSAARGALLGAGLSAGTELGLMGAGRLLGFGREFTPDRAAQFMSSAEYSAVKEAVAAEGVAKLEALQKVTGQATHSLDQLDELHGLYGTPEQQRLFTEATDKVRDSAQAVRQQESANNAALKLLDPQSPIPSQYTTSEPYDPTGRRLLLAHVLAKGIETPTGFLRKMGVSGVRFLQEVTAAEHEVAMGRSINAQFVKDLRDEAAGVMGVKASKLAHDSGWLMPLVHAYEKDGLDGVARAFNDPVRSQRAVQLFQKFETVGERYRDAVKLGAEDYLAPAEMQRLGVKGFWPHVMLPIGDDEMFDRRVAALMKAGKSRADAEMSVASTSLSSSESRQGLKQFGSQDFRREGKGSLHENLMRGEPLMSDPLQAMEHYLNDISTSVAYAKRFGYGHEARTQLKDTLLKMTKAEGGSVPLMNSMTDDLLFNKYYGSAMRQAAQAFTSLQTAAKLPFAVLGNMSGVANAAVLAGTTNTLRGLKTIISDPTTTHWLRHVMGLNESLFASLRRSYMGQSLSDTILDKVSDGVLNVTGFNLQEKFNRLLSGAAVYHSILDDTSMGAAGRLRGTTLDAARRRWATYGLDLDHTVRGVRSELANGSDLKQALDTTLGDKFGEAVWNGAMVSQSIPTRMARPTAWSTPVGRVLTQFKSFSLNQGRLIRDNVLREAALGNPVPLAYMASVYPIAGDFVRLSQTTAKGQKRKQTGFDRYIDDISTVGGFGLTHQLLQSLKYGDLDGFLLGPTYSDTKRGLGALYQLTFEGNGKAAEKFVTQQPAYQAIKQLYNGGVGMLASDVDKYASVGRGTSNTTQPTIDIGDMFKRAVEAKQ